MGEAAIDLVALQEALEDAGIPVDDILECPGLGVANVRTRSAGSGDQSQLHDLLPADRDRSVELRFAEDQKVDDLGAPMEGIQFGLFASEAAANAGAPLAQLPTDPA